MKKLLILLTAMLVLTGSVAYANETDVNAFVPEGPYSEEGVVAPVPQPENLQDRTTSEKRITVSGSAAVTLEADYATVILGVRVREKLITDAQQKEAEAMNKIIEALKAHGIAEEDIHTSNFSLYPNYDYESQDANAIIDYTIENMLMVTIRNLDTVPDVLDTAMAAGANQSYGLTFLSSKSEEAYLEALPLAVENGLLKAQALAAGAGKEVGELVSVTEESIYTASLTGKAFNSPMPEMAAGTPVLANNIVVTAIVTLEYTVK